MTAQFEVGKTYSTRSICNHEVTFSYTILKRTTSTMILSKRNGEIIKRGIKVYDGQEVCYPEGKYSMCPTIRAE